MTAGFPSQVKRRTIFISPRFQFGVAMCFAAAVLAASALFAWFFHSQAKSLLRVASLKGHYHFLTAYEIVGGDLVRRIAAMSAGGLAAGLLVFLFLLRRVRRGADRLVDAFRRSVEGDLSTPTDVGGILDMADLAGKIDASRLGTLSVIREAREEAEMLRDKSLSEDEFARRWSNLKQTLRRIAP